MFHCEWSLKSLMWFEAPPIQEYIIFIVWCDQTLKFNVPKAIFPIPLWVWSTYSHHTHPHMHARRLAEVKEMMHLRNGFSIVSDSGIVKTAWIRI